MAEEHHHPNKETHEHAHDHEPSHSHKKIVQDKFHLGIFMVSDTHNLNDMIGHKKFIEPYTVSKKTFTQEQVIELNDPSELPLDSSDVKRIIKDFDKLCNNIFTFGFVSEHALKEHNKLGDPDVFLLSPFVLGAVVEGRKGEGLFLMPMPINPSHIDVLKKLHDEGKVKSLNPHLGLDPVQKGKATKISGKLLGVKQNLEEPGEGIQGNVMLYKKGESDVIQTIKTKHDGSFEFVPDPKNEHEGKLYYTPGEYVVVGMADGYEPFENYRRGRASRNTNPEGLIQIGSENIDGIEIKLKRSAKKEEHNQPPSQEPGEGNKSPLMITQDAGVAKEKEEKLQRLEKDLEDKFPHFNKVYTKLHKDFSALAFLIDKDEGDKPTFTIRKGEKNILTELEVFKENLDEKEIREFISLLEEYLMKHMVQEEFIKLKKHFDNIHEILNFESNRVEGKFLSKLFPKKDTSVFNKLRKEIISSVNKGKMDKELMVKIKEYQERFNEFMLSLRNILSGCKNLFERIEKSRINIDDKIHDAKVR